MKILQQNFFDRPTLIVVQELLGKFLVRKIGRNKIVGMITEVEAYVGHNDKASHASRGKTERTKIMFGKPGHWYVYLIYGMHYCLNIVTEKENYPAAILIRSVAIIQKKDMQSLFRCIDASKQVLQCINTLIQNKNRKKGVISGPGRVCKYFKIDKRFNEKSASQKAGLYIEDRRIKINPRKILRGKRIEVGYAGKWKDKLWRFYI